jgi:hypothetical protein
LAVGLIVIGIGSWTQTTRLNDYQAAICSVYDFAVFNNPNGNRPHNYDVEIGLIPNNQLLKGMNQTDYSMRYKWFVVYTGTNYTISNQYMLEHYTYDQSIACYISYVIYQSESTNNSDVDTGLLMILDIEMELYYEYTNVIAAICCFGVSFISLAVLGIITCWSRRRRHLDYKPIEPIDEFHIIDDPKQIRKNYDTDSDMDLNLILQSFEEAQRQLWRNKNRLRENIFDRLRMDQVMALMGEHNVKIKFQKDVHAALASIGRNRN